MSKFIVNLYPKISIFSIIFSIFIILISCSATQGVRESSDSTKINWTISELKQKINETYTSLKSFDAEGDISFETSDMNNSGTFVLSLVKPDSIFIKLEGPFGMSVASMLITRENFLYYNAMENVIYKGTTNSDNLSYILNFKINFDDLISSLSGNFFFRDTSSDKSKMKLEYNNILISTYDDSTFEYKKYWLDSGEFYINNYKIYNNSMILLLEAEYENFDKTNGIFFPDKITINKPLDKQHVWINYTRKKMNINHLNYKLKYPKSAKEIIWK
jgi:outer membrane lipoprotein-sorting protein